MPLYDVHLFAPVRVKIENVEAGSQRAAIEAAERSVDLHDLLRQDNGKSKLPMAVQYVEWDESLDGALVDVRGDEEFKQTRLYDVIDGDFVMAATGPHGSNSAATADAAPKTLTALLTETYKGHCQDSQSAISSLVADLLHLANKEGFDANLIAKDAVMRFNEGVDTQARHNADQASATSAPSL